MKEISLKDFLGIRIGNAQDKEAGTGCTVIICDAGATAGVDVRGGSPGTRETDLLDPMNLVDKVHGVLLGGGSAFGLDAAAGIMEYLEQNDIGFDVQVTKVPIVCGAVLFDLVAGDHRVRPNKEMGYAACVSSEKNDISLGNFGAGTGATVGKLLGTEYSMKGGLGAYAVQVGDLQVGAIVAVNCLGDVIDPSTGEIIAGLLNENKDGFRGTEKQMLSQYMEKKNLFSGNTTIGTIITNASFNKAEANKLASMAHNGYARSMRPAHSIFDGDTIFTMATGMVEADINAVGLLAAEVMEKAVVSAILNAKQAYGFKSHQDMA